MLVFGIDIGSGTHYFTLKAENDVGTDTKECTLTVVSSKKAPKILDAEHNYEFFHTTSAGLSRELIRAEGDAPITWSLIGPLGILPSGLSIDASSGLLVFGDNMKSGTYNFTIKAENEAGFDTRDCSLEVKFMPIFNTSWNSTESIPGLMLLSSTKFNITKGLFNFPISNLQGKIDFTAMTIAPKNKVTLRWDHSAEGSGYPDVYTHDRFSVNGAEFVKWNSYPGVGVEFTDYAGFLGGTGATFRDNSPKSDRYHYYGIATGPEGDEIRDDPFEIEKAEIGHLANSFKISLDSILNDFLSGRLSNIGGEDISSLFANSRLDSISRIIGEPGCLDYGSTVDAIGKKIGGSFNVELNQHTGTHVSGKYFVALKDNAQGSLTFSQEGFNISFQGKNIDQASQHDLYNFAFFQGAFHEAEMMEAASLGEDMFTFAFGHHGDLPGSATFEIQTSLTPGLKVNLYMFDPTDFSFTLIVKDAVIDGNGVLIYENKTMSEYVVTTQTIPGASLAAIQDKGQASWLPVMIMALVVILSAAAYVLISKKKARNDA